MKQKSIAWCWLVVAGIVGCGDAGTQRGAPTLNVGHESPAKETAIAESENASGVPADLVARDGRPPDEQITNSIQERLLNSKMAVNLQNVKIITRDGQVRLTGLVKTLEEKESVEATAKFVAGDRNVVCELEVEQ